MLMIILGHGPQPVKAEQNGARKEDKNTRSERERSRERERETERENM